MHENKIDHNRGVSYSSRVLLLKGAQKVASLSKRGLVHNHSHENYFLNLHANDISFSYERLDTKTRFKKEAKGNSEMAIQFTQ